MERVEKFVDVDRPVREVYNQWTQFEDFPRFMSGVQQVRQLDDTHLRWRASIWGKEKEWIAEVTEQDPDRRIAWRSIDGARSAGTVRFEPLGEERTRVRLVMAYEPEGFVENAGDTLGFLDAHVENAVADFKTFIETREEATGGWRGRVVDSHPR